MGQLEDFRASLKRKDSAVSSEGEIPDSTFKIHNDYIDDEIDNLNGILSTLIFEIINNNFLRQ